MSTSATHPDEGEHTYAYSRIDDRNLKAMLAQVLDRWPCAGLAVAVITDRGLAWFRGTASPMLRQRRLSRRTQSFGSHRSPRPSPQSL
jgi:hypothetical protein